MNSARGFIRSGWRQPSAAWSIICTATIAACVLAVLIGGRDSSDAATFAVTIGCVTALAWLGLHDISTMRLPTAVTAPALACMVLATPLWPDRNPWFALGGAALCGGVLFLTHVLRGGRGIGGGDIVMVSIGGMLVGPSGAFPLLLAACVPAVLWALFLTVRRRANVTIPFGPFIAFGTAVALWWRP